ncbi:MAG: hypothetical protein AB7H88_09890 [Vicinamibacterales bacterium]
MLRLPRPVVVGVLAVVLLVTCASRLFADQRPIGHGSGALVVSAASTVTYAAEEAERGAGPETVLAVDAPLGQQQTNSSRLAPANSRALGRRAPRLSFHVIRC